MKRLLFFILFLFAVAISVQVINSILADDDFTMDGYIFSKGNAIYLIQDEDFDLKKAESMSSYQFIMEYRNIYELNSSGWVKNGDKVRIWYSPKIIHEMHPARLKVLKTKKLNEK